MTGEVSNLPRGFQTLVGLKDMGQTPRQVPSVLAPTLDLRDFYLTNLRETLVENVANFTTAGTKLFASLIVPAGEVWWIHQFSINVNPLPAASTIRVRPAYQEAAGYAAAIGASASAVTGEAIRAPAVVPLILTAGSQLAAFIEVITGNADIGAGVVFSRLRA